MAGTEQAPLESQQGLDDKEFFLLRLATQPTLKFESPRRRCPARAVAWRSTQERTFGRQSVCRDSPPYRHLFGLT